jgi:cytochrome c-type biogenesis protein
MTSPSLGLAFLAGLVSCLSPCVFPLLPGYVAYLGRQAVVVPATATGPAGVPTTGRNSIVLISGAAFAAGFSTVFVLFFYILQALNVLFFVHQRRLVDVVAGIIVILLGLQTMGLIRWALLLRERRLDPTTGRGLPGAFMLGFVNDVPVDQPSGIGG